MVNSVKSDKFPLDDATLKQLILDAACKAEAIARALDKHTHPVHGGKIVPYGDTMAEMKKVQGESPYKSGYAAAKGESAPANSDEAYLRMFTRNLITPS